MKLHNRQLLIIMVWVCTVLVQVRAQMIPISPQNEEVIEKRRISMTVAGKAGAKTWLYVNNVPADSGEIRIDGQYDFLNIPVPVGPVELRAEAMGAGNRIYQAVRRVHIVGDPDTLIPDVDHIELPADNKSRKSINVKIYDAWGYPIQRVKIATVQISRGKLGQADIDSLTPGIQVPVEAGAFDITVIAASAVGKENMGIRVNEARLSIPVKYNTPFTKFILVGSLDAAVSAFESGDKDHGTPRFTLADWTHQEGKAGDVPVSGRLAFYAKGSLLEKYQVTASYDSRRTRDNQLFRDLDPDKQYALYGDASTLVYDAQTQSKFFGRIERNQSYLVAGDFNTRFRATEFAKYDRSFTGLQGSISYGGQSVTGFATLNDRSMTLDEIRGEGISGYYYLSASRITLNTDKVRIEVRDRYHPEILLDSDEKTRYVDYDINFVDGTLMFKQPVPSVDGDGNPVYIVAVYEYQTDASKNLIGGLRYEGTAGRLKLGSTFVTEEKQPSNFYMTGADAVLPVTKWLEFKGEFAQTRNQDFSQNALTGNAWMTEAEFKPYKSVLLSGYVRKVDQDFLNPSQTGSRFEVGTEKAGSRQSLDFGRFGRIRSEFYRQMTDMGTINETHVRVVNSVYEYAINKKTSAKLGYGDAERRNVGKDTIDVKEYRSRMIRGQISHNWNDKLSAEFEHEQNLAEGKTTLPTGTSLGLTYAWSEKIRFFLKQRLLNTDSRHTQTILGIDSKLNRSTQMTGKYEIGGAAGEHLNRATIGLRNQWAVRKDLMLNFAFESTATIDSLEVPTPDHNALSVSMEYLPDKPWKSSGKFELSRDKIMEKQVIALGSEFRIRDGLSMIGRIESAAATYLKTSGDVWNRGQVQLGLAYRPEQQDVFNGIAKVQLLTDKNTHVAPKTRLDRLIVSSHGFWQVTRNCELGLRFALRRLLDEESGFFSSITTTTLYSARADYYWNRRWTTGLDVRLVRLSPVKQMKSGAAAEAGYVLRQNMLVGLGYIFKQMEDPDFSYMEYGYSNVYLVFRMKFSENIFDWR
ncbi:hypothetical protein JW948_04240 [bacterium]|nr:hypothetical protein [bacterium]